MNPRSDLGNIKQDWISRVSNRLTSVEGLRKTTTELMAEFFDHLIQAVDEDNSSCMDLILLDWARARTETELEGNEKSLAPVLDTILLETVEIIRSKYSPEKALELTSVVIPIFTHSLELVVNEETRLQVQYIVGELNKARGVLEQLEKSKSDFISVAAHELRTPLTLIEGYASMYKEVFPDEESKKSQAELYMKGVRVGTNRLREIVDDMIDVSLIDNNLLSLNFQPVWINHIFESIQRELKDNIQQRKIHLNIKPFQGISEMVFADGERLYQAFRNVVMNGIKYTPDGGCVTVDGRTLSGFIEITISDTGIGIDPEYHTRIFEKFGQLGDASLHSSGKTKFKGGGPGLGLPIAKGIIDAHGGTIWVESPGFDEKAYPGSIFHIMLPLRKNPPDDKTAKLFRPLIEADTVK